MIPYSNMVDMATGVNEILIFILIFNLKNGRYTMSQNKAIIQLDHFMGSI